MRFVVGVYSKWIINTKLYAIWFTHKNDIVRGLVCRVINITDIPIEPFVEQCLVMVAILDLWSTKTENFVAYHSEINTVPTNTNMHVLSINKREKYIVNEHIQDLNNLLLCRNFPYKIWIKACFHTKYLDHILYKWQRVFQWIQAVCGIL
jgi:hypothetical protein